LSQLEYTPLVRQIKVDWPYFDTTNAPWYQR